MDRIITSGSVPWLCVNLGMIYTVYMVKKLFIFAVITGVITYVTFFVISRVSNRTGAWNDTKKINTLIYKPVKNFHLKLGTLERETVKPTPAINVPDGYTYNDYKDTSVIVYADFDEFKKNYESLLAEYVKINQFDNRIVSEITVQIMKYSESHPEIDISELKKILVKPNYQLFESAYENPLTDTLFKLMSQSKTAVFDVENKEYVNFITFIDKGYICGRLCGRGEKIYLLPNGKKFYYSHWIS